MIDEQQSIMVRGAMQLDDEIMYLKSEIIRLTSMMTGRERIIKKLIEALQGLLTAFELEADYPGERSREEASNSQALVKELIDSGYG